jgi:ACS family tartrate transporter-like MFS transporter
VLRSSPFYLVHPTRWQWLFLVEGLPAVILSFVLLLYLPDSPVGAKWLTTEERAWLLDQVGQEQKEGKIAHTHDILRALVDYRVILLGIIYFCSIGATYAFSLSAPLIVQKLARFSAAKVGFVVAGMSLLSTLCVVLVPRHSDRTCERFWHIAIPAMFAAIGFLTAGISFTPLIAIPALAIAQTGLVSAHPVVWSLPGSFLREKSAAAGIAVISSLGQFGAFLGPIWIGRMRDATQSYSIGLACLAVPAILIAATALFMKKFTSSK